MATLAVSDEERRAAAADRRQRLEDAETPKRVGRFRIERRLGAGGMGVVYVAHDDELSRDIAVKLLPPAQSDSGPRQQRLLREARAMAQVSHPNVVTVHDVGTHERQVFIAMELVEGVSLRRWLEDTSRSQAEIIERFVQAGRGLAAAHDAGLVHRDFKPDNVLVGDDGRVRVLDFGLASAADPDVVDGAVDGDLSEKLTVTGAVLGTPAYMAPEQHRGEPTDPSTDQFAFCVALYEALYGERPFGGATIRELTKNVIDGRRSPVAADADVPGWLDAVIARGLATSPADRWASMNELLAALTSDPAAGRRRRWIIAAAALALLGAGAVGYSQMSDAKGAAVDPCSDGPQRLAAVWHPKRMAELATRFSNAGVDFDRTRAMIENHARDWVAEYGASCRANSKGIGDPQGRVRRTLCVEQSLADLGASLDVFAVSSPETLRSAPKLMAAVGSTGLCDGRADRDFLPLPQDPDRRIAVQALRLELSRVILAQRVAPSSELPSTLARLESLYDRGKELGDLWSEGYSLLYLQAARFTIGMAAGSPEEMRDLVRRAETADAPHIAATLQALLAYFAAGAQQWELFDERIGIARAKADALESPDARLLAAFVDMLATSRRPDFSDRREYALATVREVLVLVDGHPAGSFIREISLGWGAQVALQLGDEELARRVKQIASEDHRAIFGERGYAELLEEFENNWRQASNEASGELAQFRTILAGIADGEPLVAAMFRYQEGMSAAQMGDHRAAAVAFAQAVEQFERAKKLDDKSLAAQLAYVVANHGYRSSLLGKPRIALNTYLVRTYEEIAAHELMRGDLAAAQRAVDNAEAIDAPRDSRFGNRRDQVLVERGRISELEGADVSDVAIRGQLALAEGNRARGEFLLRSAFDRAVGSTDHYTLDRAMLLLADMAWSEGDPERARAFAKASLAHRRRHPGAFPAWVARAETWLSEHPAGDSSDAGSEATR